MSALEELQYLISVFTNHQSLQIISPELTLYEYVREYLLSSKGSYVVLDELHNLMKQSFLASMHHDKCKMSKSKQRESVMNMQRIVDSLSGIDGMSVNFPWKIRHNNKFIDFVKSVPGLIVDFDDKDNVYRVCMDNEINVRPFFKAIEYLPLSESIGYLLSNDIRKNRKYKYMKRNVTIYKQSFVICKLLQYIHFDCNSLEINAICNRFMIHNWSKSYSISLQTILRDIMTQNNNEYNNISALELFSYLECDDKILPDLDVSFYANTTKQTSGFHNINWSKIPEIIQPKWLLNQSNKSAINIKKSIQWKQYQIETFYETLKLLCSSQQSLKIIDFGSGAGNVTLCLAYLLPSHTFICVEYQQSRIELAKHRAKQANVDNVKFISDRIENINIAFDIGIAIHACGILTDYAQLQCIKHNASFILSSCCNGKCCNQYQRDKQTDVDDDKDTLIKSIQFPRSKCFRNAIQAKDKLKIFKTITLFSDFNFDTKRFDDDQKENDKQFIDYCRYNIKRKCCKILCEIDRCFYALEIENGYDWTILTQINPNNKIFESSPKSDVIIGIHSNLHFERNRLISKHINSFRLPQFTTFT